ncbi:MAG: MtrB/PioB family outer membrane beta-barrel protein, partial [Proteobacteria bacterium]|nr:MtrB/PioB family outer membrane beta-barrel protein [Pseudomonadota bacterium]
AQSDTLHGAMDLIWIPAPDLNLFLKYRHQELETDNPDSVTLQGLTTTNIYPSVRDSVSSIKDSIAISARYKPLRKVTLLSTYELISLERKNIDDWQVLPERTDINSIKLAADTRPFTNLKLKAAFNYLDYDDPALNTEPDSSNQIHLLATYTYAAWITANLDYKLTRTERQQVRYLNNDPATIVDNADRETRQDMILGSLSFLLTPKTNLTASWVHLKNNLEQTLAYGKWNALGTGGDLPYLGAGDRYTDTANTYGLNLYFRVRKDISTTFEISHTDSKGDFAPGAAMAQTPVSIASFSPLKVSETLFSIESTKTFNNNWEIGIRLQTNNYNDRIDDQQDGEFYSSMISFTKYY